MKSARALPWIAISLLLGCSSSAPRRTDTSTGGASGEGGSSDTGGSGGSGGAGGSSGAGGVGGTGGAAGTGGDTGGSSGSGGSGGTGGSDTGGAGGDTADGAAGSGAGGTSRSGDTGGTGGTGGAGGAGGTGGGSGGHDALFLGSGKGAIDTSLMTGLKAKGFTVMVVADTTPAAMAAGKALVVISSTTSRGNIDAKYKDAAVPIIVMKDGVMKTLGMTGADIVTGVGMNKISMVMGADADLSAGKTGDVTVYSNTDRLFAGQMLGPDAKKIATLTGQAMQWAIFAYDKGGMMAAGAAPARRVGFFAHQDGSLSPDGLALFEAAIDWATK